jgi:hypothetical protein
MVIKRKKCLIPMNFNPENAIDALGRQIFVQAVLFSNKNLA